MPKNPSEIARLEEERAHLRSQLREYAFRDKASKAKILNELRAVEKALGINSVPYNTNDF